MTQPPAPVPDRQISSEMLEQVIRRAAELQFTGSATDTDRLSESEVMQIAAEVGIDDQYVRRALAETRASALVPDLPAEEGFLFRLTGPATVQATRTVPGHWADVYANLAGHLRGKQLLKEVRSRQGQGLWEPQPGALSQMKMAFDFSGKGYVLAKTKNLQVSVEPLEDGWSMAAVTADLTKFRGDAVGGAVTGVGFSGVGLGLGAAAIGGILPIVGAVVVWGGISAAIGFSTRREMAKRRARTLLELDGILDHLERGERLDDGGEPWHKRILGQIPQ